MMMAEAVLLVPIWLVILSREGHRGVSGPPVCPLSNHLTSGGGRTHKYMQFRTFLRTSLQVLTWYLVVGSN